MQFTSNAGSLREKLSVVAMTQATARKIFLAENTALKLNAYSNNNYRHIWKHPINDKERIWRVSSFNDPIMADSAKFKEYLRMRKVCQMSPRSWQQFFPLNGLDKLLVTHFTANIALT